MRQTPPLLEPEDMPDLRHMSPEELALVPFDKRRLGCCVEGCIRYSSVKDYGMSPIFLWGTRWTDLSAIIFFCGGHYKPIRAQVRRKAYNPGAIYKLKPGAGLDHLHPKK